jgi:hypothetical protein
MKKQLIAVLTVGAVSLTGVSSLFAQETATAKMTGKEILAKHVEASGGAEKLKSLKSSKTTVKFKMPAAGIEAPMTIIFAQPQRAFMEMEIPGLGKINKGTDGDVAWETNAMSGPRIMEGAEKDQFLREADPISDLHPDKYFKSIENLGIKKVDDQDCYEVKFTTKDDKEETKFYDAKTFLVTKSEQMAETPMGEINISSVQSDYKLIDGMQIPHKIEINSMGQQQIMEVESIEFNIDLEEGTFDIPDEIKELQSADAS